MRFFLIALETHRQPLMGDLLTSQLSEIRSVPTSFGEELADLARDRDLKPFMVVEVADL